MGAVRSGRAAGRNESGGNGRSPASGEDASEAAPPAPKSAGEPNEVLKRLMQLREKENQ